MSWPEVPLGEVATFVRGVTYKKEQASATPSEGSLPLLRATNIGDALDLEHGLLHVPSTVVKPVQRLARGDIVLASSSGSLSVVGKSALLQRDWLGTFGAFCAVIRSSDRVDPRFLALYLSSHAVRARWSEAARGTNINNLKRGDLDGTPVPLPDVPEQHRIVAILEDHLSRLDAANAGLVTGLRRLDVLRLSHLAAVRRSLVESGVETLRIGDVADTSLGKMLDAKRQQGVPTSYLRNINVRWGQFDMRDIRETPLLPDEIERLRLEPGDVMVCEGGEPGRCAVWTDSSREIAFQKALHRLRVKNRNQLVPEYLALMLMDEIRSGRSNRLFTGTTIKHLPQEKLRLIEIPVPPIAQQLALLAEATDQHDRLESMRRSVAAARQRSTALRRSLLSAAFSGRLTEAVEDVSAFDQMVDA